jgi:D-aminoacyl-tRNA deacylase
MRIVLQRVSQASVTVDGTMIASIEKGFLVLAGIEEADDNSDAEWLAMKISAMRLFADENGKMNLDLMQAEGALLVVPQFTLHASTKKGNRPSFIRAARPEQAVPVFEHFVRSLASHTGKPCATGRFGADMKVALVNDGPVTIVMDSRNRE